MAISWPVKSNLFQLIFMVAHASRVLVSVSRRNNLIYPLKSFLRSEKSAMARTPLLRQLPDETHALPDPPLRFGQICLVDFKSDKFFHATALRGHGRIPDPQKRIQHCMHT